MPGSRSLCRLALATGLSALMLTAPVSAKPLKPYQQKALEKIVANEDPSMRADARRDLEEILAPMSKEEVAEFLATALENQKANRNGSSWGDDEAAIALKPYQEKALETLLQREYPENRDEARPNYARLLAPLDKEEVRDLLDAVRNGTAEDVPAPLPRKAPAEDLAFNKAQYEPVIRKVWEAQRACAAFVADALPRFAPEESYAVWEGSINVELMELNPSVADIPANYDDFAEVFQQSAPVEARYDFDFSAVRTGCDRKGIEAVLRGAKADYETIGKDLVARVRALVSAGGSADEAGEMERVANNKVMEIAQRVSDVLTEHGPSGQDELMEAITNPKPAKR